MSRSGNSDITLEQILEPLAVGEFLARSWKQTPLHLAGKKCRFSNVLGWPELNRMLESAPLSPKRLRVMRNGKRLSDDLFLTRTKGLDAGALSLILAQGATLVVDFIDDILPNIGRVADSAADGLTSRVWINLYASWGRESGLKLHSDSHDVIVMQMAGAKEWKVYPPARLNPNDGDEFEAPAADVESAWTGVLSDGDVLYIPRGWPHIAAPTGEPSLHLTIGLAQPTGSAYLRWLAEELDNHPEVRAAIPQPRVPGNRDAWLAQTRRLVEQAINVGSINAFLNYESAMQPARRRFALPAFARTETNDWSAETAFRLASTRCLDIRDCEDGTVSIASAGRKLSGPSSIAPALRLLSSRDPVALSAMEKALDPQASQGLRRTLAIMVQLGILFSEHAA